jgi:parvulin-like peptidyl-prolyl isomerase
MVAGRPITVRAFEAEMLRRGGRLPGQFTTEGQKRALLDEMIAREVQVASARRVGYDRDPEVLAALDRLMVGKLREAELEQRLAGLAVTDEEVEAHYREHTDRYAEPPRSRVAIVQIAVPSGASEAKRAELRARAAQVLEEARAVPASGRGLGAVAARHSDHRPSRYVGGDLGWLEEGQAAPWDPTLVAAAFALTEPGALGPLVEAADGFYVIRLIERRPGRVRELAEVADGVRGELLRRKRAEAEAAWLDSLRNGARVEVNEALLRAVEPPAGAPARGPEAGPPGLPSG